MIRHSQRTQRGFTLVELLVVITIIGMLAGLVLGGMPVIMERGRRTQCANNLKQMWISLHSYAADNDERLPFTGQPADSANKHFGLLFPRWLRKEAVFICNGAKTRGYRADDKVDDDAAPAARSDSSRPATEASRETKETLKPGENCYAYAFGLGGAATQDSPLACDQLGAVAIANEGWKKSGVGSNHSNSGGTVLYMDGHVEFISATAEGYWPPRRPKIKAMEKGKACDPANADRAPDDAS